MKVIDAINEQAHQILEYTGNLDGYEVVMNPAVFVAEFGNWPGEYTITISGHSMPVRLDAACSLGGIYLTKQQPKKVDEPVLFYNPIIGPYLCRIPEDVVMKYVVGMATTEQIESVTIKQVQELQDEIELWKWVARNAADCPPNSDSRVYDVSCKGNGDSEQCVKCWFAHAKKAQEESK